MEDDDAVELDELQFTVEEGLDDEDEDDDDDEEEEQAARSATGYRRKRRRRRRKSVPLCSAASAALDLDQHRQPRHAPRRPHGLRESLLTVLGKLVVWRHGGATQYRQTLGHTPPDYLRGFIPIGESAGLAWPGNPPELRSASHRIVFPVDGMAPSGGSRSQVAVGYTVKIRHHLMTTSSMTFSSFGNDDTFITD
jgi:hypothetical protein